MPIKDTILFHPLAITTGSGNVYSVVNANPLSKLYITTSSSAVGSVRTIVFEASNVSASSTYFPVLCTNMTTLTTGSLTTSNNAETWILNDLGGLRNVRCVINALSSGSITIQGTHVW